MERDPGSGNGIECVSDSKLVNGHRGEEGGESLEMAESGCYWQ